MLLTTSIRGRLASATAAVASGGVSVVPLSTCSSSKQRLMRVTTERLSSTTASTSSSSSSPLWKKKHTSCHNRRIVALANNNNNLWRRTSSKQHASFSTHRTKDRQLATAQDACQFFSHSTDPYHAVANSVQTLESAGFERLSVRGAEPSGTTTLSQSQIEPGKKYFYTVQGSTLVAFVVGPKFDPVSSRFTIVGGHTDSPVLKLKPRSKVNHSSASDSVIQLGVETYGGGLWHTWLDRDLSVSGSVLVQTSSTPSDDNNDTQKKEKRQLLEHRLVQLRDPIARVSSLCIHLQTAEERKALELNKETHTVPMIGTTTTTNTITKQMEEQINNDPWLMGQDPLLLQRVAEELQVKIGDIKDWDLTLHDTQPAAIGGIEQDFIYSARLDNLATVYCAITALVNHSSSSCDSSKDVALVVCFDHEEVGSVSSIGAGSPVLEDAVRRIASGLYESTCVQENTGNDKRQEQEQEQQEQQQQQQQQQHSLLLSPYEFYKDVITHRSFCLSMDQAHAVHPNYAAKHERHHGPQLNQGIVIKTNSNQRYATNSSRVTGFLIRELARQKKIPVQEFVVRNDCPCGSTIGPTIAARTGIRTVDVGMPQLSMHSCREVMGVSDLTHGLDLLESFFQEFGDIDDSIANAY